MYMSCGVQLVVSRVKPLLTERHPFVITVMVPVVFPAGTVALSWVSDTAVKAALTPLNCTAVVPLPRLKPAPFMVTTVPSGPEVGKKLIMVVLVQMACALPAVGASREPSSAIAKNSMLKK